MGASLSEIKDTLYIPNDDGGNLYVTFKQGLTDKSYPGISCFTNVCDHDIEISGGEIYPDDCHIVCSICNYKKQIELCEEYGYESQEIIPQKTVDDINHYIKTNNIKI